MNTEAHPVHETEKSANSTAIDFIYSDHSPENLSKIVDALIESNGDIIALEKIREGSFGTGTVEEKKELSKQMTDFLDPDSTIEESAEEYFPGADPLFVGLLNRLKGSGKQIVIIDMGTDDPGYHYYADSIRLREKYVEKFEEYQQGGDVTREELENLTFDVRISMAQSYEYREHVIEGQLRELASRNPDAKISVMLGAMHTPVHHGMVNDYDVSRKFIPTDEDEALYSHGVKMRFEHAVPVRTLRFRLGELGLSVVDADQSSEKDKAA